MRLLITGGCGFLGSNLAAHAIKSDLELIVFDNLSRVGSVQNLQWLKSLGNFEFVHGDIRNQGDVAGLVASHRPDAVFHLAGQVAMTTSLANPRMDFEVNALGTFNLLEAVRQHAPEAAIFYSSTNKVYGDLERYTYLDDERRYRCQEHPRGFDEQVPLDFSSPYGCSKGAADQYILDYARVFGLKTVVFRHSSMYGGRQYSTYDQGWIGWFCQKALETRQGQALEPFTISGTGKQVRDVLHAEDMVSLYYAGMARIEQIQGQAFNIGGGIENSLSLLELFDLLEELLEVDLDYVKLPPRESDQKFFVADIGKARELIGWKPLVSARKGLQAAIAWNETGVLAGR